MSEDRLAMPEGYRVLLGDLKERIRVAQVRAALSVNRELVLLYWNVGRDILVRQQEHGWGAQIIDRLAADLRHAFPQLKGFSRRNLHYMRAMAEAYPDEQFVQQAVAQIPWGHHVRLLDRVHALLAHIQEFLLELGVGFAFVGSQYHLDIGDQDFYLDLLFYHLKLRAFVVIDLKLAAFQPEDAGKMNFYLSAVDDLLRHPDDQPSIGLILCKAQNKVVAAYALRDMSKPIGVSAYQFTAALPERLRGSLPTIEELEAGLRESPGE